MFVRKQQHTNNGRTHETCHGTLLYYNMYVVMNSRCRARCRIPKHVFKREDVWRADTDVTSNT